MVFFEPKNIGHSAISSSIRGTFKGCEENFEVLCSNSRVIIEAPEFESARGTN